MKQIFLAHPIPFAAKILEEFLALKGVKTYLLGEQEFSDFRYLLADLSPEVFIIHESLLIKNKELLLAQLKDFPKVLKCLISKEGHGHEDKWDIVVTQPFDPADFYSLLETECTKLLAK